MDPKTCEVCGCTFLPSYRVARRYWATRRFCSELCRDQALRGQPHPSRGRERVGLAERFWSKVDRRGDAECWPWRGATTDAAFGYGYLGVTRGQSQLRAHRVSWELHFGPVPAGLVVCHHCDNPPCVNPAHLFIGDRADNNRDRGQKGRGGNLRGERGGNARLTTDQVRTIRHLVSEGSRMHRDIASDFGISATTMSRIVNRHTWQSLGG